MALSAIATRRRILIEKFVGSKTKLNKLYVLEFENSKLLINLNKSPKAKIQKHIINECYQTGFRVFWNSLQFAIIDNVGEGNATNFCRWINDSLSNKKNKTLARNFVLTRLYDDESPTKEKLSITGCNIESVILDKFPLVVLSVNNCSTV